MPKRKSRVARAVKSKKNVEELVEHTPAEQLEHVIADLEAQFPRKIEAFVKEYEREATKMIKMLPDKSTIPTEIYNMPYNDFILRGGTFEAVIDSLREDKLRDLKKAAFEDYEAPQPSSTDTEALPSAAAANKFVTPCVSTKSKRATTTQRLPKPLEEVLVSTVSKETGSPLNVTWTMKTHEDCMRKKFEDKVRTAISGSKMPKKWRLLLDKALADMEIQEEEEETTSESSLTLVTPAVTSRTRAAALKNQQPAVLKKANRHPV